MNSIDEILGAALGCLGISYDDFCALSPDEFNQVYRFWAERETERLHGEWERTRVQAFFFAQPYLKKGVSAKKILPLPWDGKPQKGKPSTRSRFDEIVKKTQDYGIDNQHNLQTAGGREDIQGAGQ